MGPLSASKRSEEGLRRARADTASRFLTPDESLSTSVIPVYAPLAWQGFVTLSGFDCQVRFVIVWRSWRSFTAAAMPSGDGSKVLFCCSDQCVPPYAYLAVDSEKPLIGGGGLFARKPQFVFHAAAAFSSFSIWWPNMDCSWTSLMGPFPLPDMTMSHRRGG